MVDLNTLGDLLLRKYTVDFINNMQNLSSPIFSTLRSRFVHTVMGSAPAGTIIKIDDLDSDWALRETDTKPYSSLISHKCHSDSTVTHLMSLHRDSKETCYYCEKQIPTDIIGLWKMHNFEVIQDL